MAFTERFGCQRFRDAQGNGKLTQTPRRLVAAAIEIVRAERSSERCYAWRAPFAPGFSTTLMQPSCLSWKVLYISGPRSSDSVCVMTNERSIWFSRTGLSISYGAILRGALHYHFSDDSLPQPGN